LRPVGLSQCLSEEGAAELEGYLVTAGEAADATATLALDVAMPGGRARPRLSMPSPSACLAPDLSGEADEEFSIAQGKGLSAEQVRVAVRGFQEQTLRCHTGGGASGTVQLSLLVGCDGRVVESEVSADTTGDTAFAECVADTFRYAPFPAHDRDGGALFELPLRYQ